MRSPPPWDLNSCNLLSSGALVSVMCLLHVCDDLLISSIQFISEFLGLFFQRHSFALLVEVFLLPCVTPYEHSTATTRLTKNLNSYVKTASATYCLQWTARITTEPATSLLSDLRVWHYRYNTVPMHYGINLLRLLGATQECKLCNVSIRPNHKHSIQCCSPDKATNKC